MLRHGQFDNPVEVWQKLRLAITDLIPFGDYGFSSATIAEQIIVEIRPYLHRAFGGDRQPNVHDGARIDIQAMIEDIIRRHVRKAARYIEGSGKK